MIQMRKRGYCRIPRSRRNPSHLGMVSVDEDDDGEVDDVDVAIRILRQNMQNSLPVTSPLHVAPLILKSHIATIIDDTSDIERVVDCMRRRNDIRLIRMTNSTEVALMLTSDYNRLIQSISNSNQKPEFLQLQDIMTECVTMGTSDSELHRLMGSQMRKCPDFNKQLTESGFLRQREALDGDNKVHTTTCFFFSSIHGVQWSKQRRF